MLNNEKKVAIVTGGSRGIGAEIAQRLSRDGFSIVVNYVNNSDAAARVVDSIKRTGGEAVFVKADISKAADFALLFNIAEQKFGGVDVLVNNAGTMKLSTIENFKDEDFDQTVAINLKGTFNGVRESAKRMREGGRIVNFSTSVIGLYQPTYAVYAATKAGVEAMTHIAAKELGARHITVNTVSPGPIATELFLTGKDENLIDSIRKMNPLGRLGETQDIASVVSFLVGPDGGWVNSQVLKVNGGVV